MYCRYVPSFLPPPMATKGRDYEKKVSGCLEVLWCKSSKLVTSRYLNMLVTSIAEGG